MTSTSTTTVTPSTISVKGPRDLHSWMIAIAEAGERATAIAPRRAATAITSAIDLPSRNENRGLAANTNAATPTHTMTVWNKTVNVMLFRWCRSCEPQLAPRGQCDEGQGQVVDEFQLLSRRSVDELECVGSEEDPGQDVPGDLRNLEVREHVPREIGGEQQKAEGHGRPGVGEHAGVAGAEERQRHEEDHGDQPEDADHAAISRAVRSTLFARAGLSSSFRITASNTVVTTALVISVELSW